MGTKDLFSLKKELNLYLEENPHLKPYQKKIDEMLSGAASQHNRMVLLDQMMKDKVLELVIELNKLKGIIGS